IALINTKRYGEAYESFNKAAAIDPASAQAWNGRGASLHHMKKYGDAVADYDRAIEKEPSFAPAWNNKALALLGLRDYRAAEAAYERAKGAAPWWAEPRIGKTHLYLSLGSAAQAYCTAEDAVSAIGGRPELLASRGFAELALKEYGSASRSFGAALERDPGNPAHLLWQSYADFLSAGLDRSKDEDRYTDSLASILRTLEKARRLIVPEDKGEPQYPWIPREEKKPGDKDARLLSDIVYFKARCCYELGDYDKAVSELKECARMRAGGEGDVRNVLEKVWSNHVKPSVISRWLSSPVRPWPKRILFFSLILIALALVVIHPILGELIKPYRIDSAVYIFTVAVILGIIFLPLTGRPGDYDYEFSLAPDLSKDPVVTPVTLEDHIRSERRNLPA
ncbi:MAG TPA: tetratricopeptide repeat protein, partial [Thermodesulfobacteriota bacterium]|nr:tetratricopeptide repeat protein [Thermodesulfobacteriota bacterium]